jgi:hypothetical protein
VGRKPALALAALLAVGAWASSTTHWGVIIGLSGFSALRAVPWLRRLQLLLISPSSLAGTGVVAGLLMVTMVAGVTLIGDNVRALFGMSADALAGDVAVPRRAADVYAGTPARADLPTGVRATRLSEELVDFTGPRVCRVVLVRTAVVEAVTLALHLTLLVLALRSRRQLFAGLARQFEQLTVHAELPALGVSQ